MTTRRRATALAAALLAAVLLAVLFVWRASAPGEPPAAAAPAVATAPPSEPAPTAPAPGVAPALPEDPSCPRALREAEALPGPAFDARWAMCRLFGNFDPETRASRTATGRAEIALEDTYREGGQLRVALVVAQRAESADAHAAAVETVLDVHLHAQDGGLWRLERSATRVAAAPAGLAPDVRLEKAGRDRWALLVLRGGTQPGTTRLVGISEGRIAVLADDLPTGGESEPGCSPLRCFSWRAELDFSRGRGAWDDLVVHVHGTRPDDDERVWPVDERVRWIYTDGRYLSKR